MPCWSFGGSGKSTLVSALFGRLVLPSGALPRTLVPIAFGGGGREADRLEVRLCGEFRGESPDLAEWHVETRTRTGHIFTLMDLPGGSEAGPAGHATQTSRQRQVQRATLLLFDTMDALKSDGAVVTWSDAAPSRVDTGVGMRSRCPCPGSSQTRRTVQRGER